jgi:hypothetical protein
VSAGLPASALWLRATSQLRRRWRSWLGLALLIGLAGGAVLGAAAGARRTSSAYDRLASSADAFTVVLGIECQDEESPSCGDEQRGAAEQVLTLPEVMDGVVVTTFLLPVLDDEGRSIQPQEESTGASSAGEVCVTGSGEVDVIGSADGRLGTELNRHRFVEGRAADPSRADEVVLSVATARRADVGVGEVLTVVPVGACDDIPTEEWPAPIKVTVVGLQVSPGEVQPEAGRYLQSVTVTPPLLERITRETRGGGDTPLMLRLRPGVDVMELEAAIEATDLVAQPIILGDELAASVRRGHRQDAVSLWLLVGLGGVASLVVLGLALARQVSAAANEVPLLRAVGLTTRDLVLAGTIEGAAAGAVAGVVAVAVASAASIVTPIGRARSAEPNPGFDIDGMVLGPGAIAVLTVVALIVAGVSRFAAVRSTSAGGLPLRQSVVVRAITRTGLPVPASIGAHLALSRGGGPRPVPVRSGLIATAVGFAALTGSLSFGADLEHLLGTPRLVGWNWDVAFFGGLESDGSEAEDPRSTVDAADALIRRALALPGVERAGYLTVFPPSEVPPLASIPDIRPMSFSSGPGSISPTLTSGRAPAGPEEVLVTSSVLAELDAQVGEDIEVQAAAVDDSGELTFEPRSMTVVGTGVLPLGDGGFDRAVSFTFEGLQRLAPDVVPHLVVVDLRPGSTQRATLVALEETGLSGPLRAGDIDVTELVDLDVQQADNVPRLFGGLMAVLGLGVLMHLVLTGLQAGRRELATLRALGFTTRQVRSSAAWQASVATVVPFVVGAIVGAVVGRRVWLAYADRLNVAPATVSGWRPIVGFFLAFLVLANVIGALAAWRAVRRRSSVELRSE